MEVIARIKKQQIIIVIIKLLLLLLLWISNAKLKSKSSANYLMGYSAKSWKRAALSNKKLVQKHPHF